MREDARWTTLKSTYVQRLQAVPAESMLAVLAHHLGTSFVSLDVNLTFGTALDRSIIIVALEERTGTERDRLSSMKSYKLKHFL